MATVVKKMTRRTLRAHFATPGEKPTLRIIVATVGPGKTNLLALIDETGSISEAARRMGMSYKRAWQLVLAMNECFREPVVESITGGARGGRSQLSPLGKQILAFYRAICAKSLSATAKEVRQLHALLKAPG